MRFPPTRRHLALFVLIAAYACLFGRAATHGYVWDDIDFIAENALFDAPLLEGMSATQHDHHDPSLLDAHAVPYESYRPLMFASLRADTALFGRSPRAMHVHSLILGGLCVLLAWGIARRCLPGLGAPLAAAALFALHPLQVEAVSYVSARGDLLAALFALLASLAFLSAIGVRPRSEDPGPPDASPDPTPGRATWIAVACVTLLASLAAKESYAGLPLVLAAWAFGVGRLREAALPLGAWAGALALYALGRVAIVSAELTAVAPGTALPALWHLPGVALEYLSAFALPAGLSIERPTNVGLGLAALGWLLLGALAALAVIARRGSVSAWRGDLGAWRPDVARACVAGLAFVILLGPSALAIETTGVASDRYVYLPLLAVAIAVAGLGRRLLALQAAPASPVMRGGLAVAFSIWALGLLAHSFVYVGTWSDDRTLFGRAVAAEPGSSMAHYRLGAYYARVGRWEEALPRFVLALERDPANLRALGNHGLAALHTGQLASAERSIARDVTLSGTTNPAAWVNLATLFYKRGDLVAACHALEQSLEVRPHYEVARRNHAAFCTTGAGG